MCDVNDICYIMYFYHVIPSLVGIRCFIVGVNDVGATALWRSGSIWDGFLSPRGI